jgi:hypothetical protein
MKKSAFNQKKMRFNFFFTDTSDPVLDILNVSDTFL